MKVDNLMKSSEGDESQQLDESQLAIIKNLDRHPALVLNADYQVRCYVKFVDV